MHSCCANLLGARCADVDIHLVKVRHGRCVLATWLKMHGETGEYSGNPFCIACHDPNWLGRMQQIKNRVRRALRKTLHTKIAVWRNFTDYVSRLIDRRDNQPVRSATSKRDVNVAKIVGLWCKAFDRASYFASQLLFIPTYGGRVFGALVLRHRWLGCAGIHKPK